MRRFVHLLIIPLVVLPLASLQAAEESRGGGVTLRPTGDLTAQESTMLLGAHVWKLSVNGIQTDDRAVSYRFHLQRKGGERESFGVGLDTPPKARNSHRLLVAIIPVDGDISDAEKVRLTIVGLDGSMASRVESNPLRGLAIISSPVPEAVGNGVFNLIGGYEGNSASAPVSKADRIISLQIETH